MSSALFRKIAPCFGILGVGVFTASFLLNGWLRRDGYNWLHNYVSDLSYYPFGWIQITSFLIIGIGLFVFTLGVFRERISTAGSILLFIIAAFYFLSGPFITDPMDTPRSEMTTHGMVHGILGAMVFTLSPITALVFGLRFRKLENYIKLSTWSFIACGIMLVTVALMRLSTNAESSLQPIAGLIQRISLMTFYAWIIGFACLLRKRIPTRPPSVALHSPADAD